MFSFEFSGISKNNFFTEHLQATASVFAKYLQSKSFLVKLLAWTKTKPGAVFKKAS